MNEHGFEKNGEKLGTSFLEKAIHLSSMWKNIKEIFKKNGYNKECIQP